MERVNVQNHGSSHLYPFQEIYNSTLNSLILDGGILFHKFNGNKTAYFWAICEDYINYVKNPNVSMVKVFYGYHVDPQLENTGSTERILVNSRF